MLKIPFLGYQLGKHRGEPSCIPWIALHHRRHPQPIHLRCYLVPRDCLPKSCWWNLIHPSLEEEGNHSRNQSWQRCCWFIGIRGWMHNSRYAWKCFFVVGLLALKFSLSRKFMKISRVQRTFLSHFRSRQLGSTLCSIQEGRMWLCQMALRLEDRKEHSKLSSYHGEC